MTKSAEEKIAVIVAELRAKGRPVPRTVSEIPCFPRHTWVDLQDAWKAERLRLQRFAYKLDRDIFDLFASRGEQIMLTVYTSAVYLVPVACAALAFVHSWWWLIGIVFPAIGVKKTQALYNGIIYRTAFSSEDFFCFLYFARQVSVTTADYRKSYFWNPDEEAGIVAASVQQGEFHFKESTRQLDRDSVRKFEQEIASWRRERAVGALRLLEAVLSGDKAAAERLHPELTPMESSAVTNFLKRSAGMAVEPETGQ